VDRLTEGGAVTLGRPIAETSVHVLDARLRPVPVGAAGELAIGGRGLARGYLRRPAATAERFVPAPQGPPGARLYRTGDLVRRRPDGRLDYLGRLDHQVKLRGHRIELGEVEAALARHPGVARAVAAVREVGPEDRRLVAYAVPAAGARPAPEELREHLRAELPESFVPSAFVLLDELPLTPNGKVDRKALPAPAAGGGSLTGSAAPTPPRSELERAVARVWCRVLGVESVGVHESFFDLGGHSLLLARVRRELETEIGRAPRMVDLFRHPTVAALAAWAEHAEGPAAGEESRSARAPAVPRAAPAGRDVAVIGMAGRFPGAGSVGELWRRLRAGEECITLFSKEELAAAGVAPALLADPRYVPAAAVLDGADLFDADFFGVTAREAELMDPQHRIFLECAWEALEDAGHARDGAPGRVGVFAGVGMNTYVLQAGLGAELSTAARYQAFVGNDKDFVPTRVSYKLDLRGPSVNVQTACSSSLVAVHLACRSLLDGECETALAGGVTVRVPLREGYLYEEGGIPSPDGHCRPFDAAAAGTVFGSGVGIVVLKPLERALADGDAIRAVIRGSAVNNDGAGKIGYTAPSVAGQAAVVRDALAAAGVEPATVSYVEAHGTGTALGDPVEVAALTEAFGGGLPPGSCALGSVKGNLGHLDTAAGVAGLIKAVKALEEGEIPGTLHFREASPELGLDAGPFHVPAGLAAWPENGAPRRAGVSSFGIGGTNAHAVLEEAPAREEHRPSRPSKLLLLSARSAAALEAATTRLAERLREAAASGGAGRLDLADVAFTLQTGRRRFAHRRALVAADPEDALAALEASSPLDRERLQDRVEEARERPVAFLFPGQGAQHPGMARGLYESEPAFRRELDACSRHLEPRLGLDLRQALFAEDDGAAEALRRTALAQPALFAVEYALARLWMAWGVTPAAMLGHSVGEYVAACLAGVFSLEDALDLVAVRGRLMQAMPRGAMLAVDAAEEEVAGLLGPLAADLALAAVNGPGASVVAGPEGAVRALEERLARDGVRARRLHTSHAFHSPLMAGAVEGLVAEVRRIGPRAPRLPFVSNVTGTWITAAQATDPAYWGRQLRETVRFGDGLARLLEDPAAALLEVGPGRSLAGLVRRAAPERVVVSSLPHPREPEDDGGFLLLSLGRLWLAGAEIDWAGFAAHERRRRVPLPTYPFERRRFWLEARPAAPAAAPDLVAPAREPADWLSAPSWRSAPPRAAAAPGPPSGPGAGSWLVVDGGDGLGRPLASALKERIGGGPGSGSEQGDAGVARVGPVEAEERLAALARSGHWEEWPDRVVHALALGPEAADPEVEVERAYQGLARLVRVLGAAERPVRLDVLSQGLHRVCGEGPPIPLRSLLLGPVLSAPLEYPRLVCRSIDLPAAMGPDDWEDLLDDLLAELLAEPAGPAGDPVVALRGGRRWTRAFEPVRVEAGEGSPRLREGGHYLVTGGLGGLGLALAEDLARRARARLTLVGRSAPPPRERWAELAAGTDEGAERARRLLSLEEAGGEVLALSADVADPAAMARALARAEERFGPVHGVVHAAGVAGGSLLQLETPEAARAVLRPKVEGTRVLRTLLAAREPDFLVLVSSVNAVAGGLGQAAYTAANAHLDAVAETAFRRRAPAVLSIGWGRWAGVGMAARGVDPVGGASAPTGHPLLGAALLESPGRSVYRSELSPESHWVLSEHRVAGRPTVPGAAWLEAVRAAAARRRPGADVELRDVVFPEPLAVSDGGSAEVLTVLDAEGGAGPGGAGGVARFRVVTRGVDGAWREHARGRVAVAAPEPAKALDLDGLRAACALRVLEAGEGEAQLAGGLLATGPRWRSLRRLRVGEDRLLAELELDPRFAGDLESHVLHPALLDLAAGAVRLAAGGSYLPLAYGRVTVRRPLPARCFASAILAGPLAGAPETLRCDVTVLDGEGRPLVEVEGFAMRRVDPAAAARITEAAAAGPPAAGSLLAELEPGLAGAPIPVAAGVEAFHRALAASRVPHLLVTPDPPEAAIRALRSLDRDRLAERLAGLAGPPPALDSATGERPSAAAGADESTLLVGGELERRIAAVWRRVLGVERVGLHDNFFELGGTSLSGIQLVSELGRELAPALGSEVGERLSPVALFEAPTVAALARSLRPAGEGAESTTERARSRAERKARALGEAAARAPRRAPDRRVAAG
jgi:acyl transferase domain-containing protein